MTFNSSDLAFEAELLRFARVHLALPDGHERDPFRCDDIDDVMIKGEKTRRHPDCPNGGETWSYRIEGPDFSFNVEAIWRDGELFKQHRYLKITALKGEGSYQGSALADVKKAILEWLSRV